MSKPNPCQKEACDIQSCLQKNNYSDAKCIDFINKLADCCLQLREKGEDSPVCPKKISKK
ncbi:hypothetical protein CONCODRAFT_78994 [Conidiobolus coronatus NRRL 28638]|uniref:Cx9C motif-containing protein 4, mitochondrial n=1 Tax=Conidiobolus coronatus (strain ATCC 28846 / CBS 209.66 / NRRL 28638) TaxID=796925 RepID=A0A137P595_CONC2|nr:hypothetical protein CONCODRAFT_78994 [Conidiobolus coronatus NRRL 28638]|eukprot:KXN70173.1 hypothetical protein CONCODRAFT_78994 [Conidiobolus coronatus NRRL 28638]